MDVRLDFHLRGRPGHVDARVLPSTGPSDSGLHLLDPSLPATSGVGLPVCTATVSYDGAGYAAAMGWVRRTATRSTTSCGWRVPTSRSRGTRS